MRVEMWRSIYGYTGLYDASHLGRIRNARTGQILRPRPLRSESQLEKVPSNRQYWTVGLYKNGKRRNRKIHRLVCRTFRGPSPKKKGVVDHIDNDPSNNCAFNLQWLSRRENQDRRNGISFEEVWGEA